MADKINTGIFFCNYNPSSTNDIDVNELLNYAKSLPEIVFAKNLGDSPKLNQKQLSQDISSNNIEHIVIAGDSPGFFKSNFVRAMKDTGKIPSNIVLASFREHIASSDNQTERAKNILQCAILDVPYELVAEPAKEKLSSNQTLIIGAGIAGIQASLEIANAGYNVILVEKTGSIGGHMAMFDKTFPTLDCAACILTPKMVEVGQHQNIELMTFSEVKSVSGEPGNWTAKILKHARRVNITTCIGCGICTEKCPGRAPSEFDSGTTLKTAIYMPFPQAVPNKYLIDPDACLYVKNGKCGVCVKNCPVEGCINLDEKDEEVTINVGNIIVATGFKIFDAKKAENYGYGKFPNVITSLEFERLINAAGPTEGNIKLASRDKKGNRIFTKEGQSPKSIAIIHCIGSRDHNYNPYCSRVCCMYSLKFAHLVKEKMHDVEIYEYYIDMRAFGKGYEEFFERIKNEGVHIIRGRSAKIEELEGKLVVRSEDMVNSRLIEQKVDMVILSVGLEPAQDSSAIARMLGINRSEDGWFIEKNFKTSPVDTFKGGIFIAGVCQGPKDIPDSVAQASAAAARVLQSITKGKVSKSIEVLTISMGLKH